MWACISQLEAMDTLHAANKPHDLVHKFTSCIAEKRPDSNVSLMPLDRMPFGLIQYQIEFFTAGYINQVVASIM
jgi:hypothetical protein